MRLNIGFSNVSQNYEGLPLQVRYKLHCRFENSLLGNIIMMYSSNGNSSNERKYSGIMYPVFLCVLHQFTMLVYMVRSVTRFTACQMLWNTKSREPRKLQFIYGAAVWCSARPTRHCGRAAGCAPPWYAWELTALVNLSAGLTMMELLWLSDADGMECRCSENSRLIFRARLCGRPRHWLGGGVDRREALWSVSPLVRWRSW
jgi:hypothetical protein